LGKLQSPHGTKPHPISYRPQIQTKTWRYLGGERERDRESGGRAHKERVGIYLAPFLARTSQQIGAKFVFLYKNCRYKNKPHKQNPRKKPKEKQQTKTETEKPHKENLIYEKQQQTTKCFFE